MACKTEQVFYKMKWNKLDLIESLTRWNFKSKANFNASFSFAMKHFLLYNQQTEALSIIILRSEEENCELEFTECEASGNSFADCALLTSDLRNFQIVMFEHQLFEIAAALKVLLLILHENLINFNCTKWKVWNISLRLFIAKEIVEGLSTHSYIQKAYKWKKNSRGISIHADFKKNFPDVIIKSICFSLL